jgi:hypothetical protein
MQAVFFSSSFGCLQTDLIIVVVFIIVLYVSCSFTEQIVSLSLFAFEPKRERKRQ